MCCDAFWLSSLFLSLMFTDLASPLHAEDLETLLMLSLSAQSLLASWWYWFLYGWSSTIDAFKCLKEFIFQITSWTQKKSVSSISGSSCHHPELYYEIVNSLVMISGHKTRSSNSLRTWLLVYLLSYPRKIYKLSVLLLLQSVSPLWLYFLSPHLYPRSWASSTPPFFSPSLISQ